MKVKNNQDFMLRVIKIIPIGLPPLEDLMTFKIFMVMLFVNFKIGVFMIKNLLIKSILEKFNLTDNICLTSSELESIIKKSIEKTAEHIENKLVEGHDEWEQLERACSAINELKK